MSPTRPLILACYAATLMSATSAFAQAEPAPPAPVDQTPPPARPYPPPPPPPIDQTPYPYSPPPAYGNSYLGPQRYPGAGIYRPFSFSVGLGPALLAGPPPTGGADDEHDLALSYLFRLGFGVARNLSFVLSFEGSGTSSVSPQTNENSWLSQNMITGGLQFHFIPPLYVRAGIGAAWVSETTNSVDNSTSGIGFSGGVGYEFVESMHTALALEAAGNVAQYSGKEVWGTAGVNLVVSFF